MTVIADLLTPLSEECFFRDYWNQRCAYLPGKPDRFASFFPAEAFSQALFGATFGQDDISAVEDGLTSASRTQQLLRCKESWSAPPTFEEISEACGNATLIFNRIHRNHEGLRAWTLQLVQALCEEVGVNAYFSPQHAPSGLGAHFDPQELFILQISGSKQWALHETLETYPLKYIDYYQPRGLPPGAINTICLQPGDVLYLPRGMWHRPLA